MICDDLFQYPTEITLEFAKTAHRLFRFYCNEFENVNAHIYWNWSSFYTLLQHDDEETRWNTAKTIILLGNNNQYVAEEILNGICSTKNDQIYLRLE